MKTIALTKGASTIIDDEDYDRVSQHKWHLSSTGYAVRTLNAEGKKLGMHQYVLGAERVDHINGDPLDNRRSNLRPASQRQNTWNRKKPNIPTTSQYKGVCFHKGMWHVNVAHKYRGYFKDEVEAARRYNEVAAQLYGSFAKLNDLGELD